MCANLSGRLGTEQSLVWLNPHRSVKAQQHGKDGCGGVRRLRPSLLATTPPTGPVDNANIKSPQHAH